MSEFLTSYPRTINLLKGFSEFIRHEEIQFDQLSLMVKVRKEELKIRKQETNTNRKRLFEKTQVSLGDASASFESTAGSHCDKGRG
jgi:hypothetical protein